MAEPNSPDDGRRDPGDDDDHHDDGPRPAGRMPWSMVMGAWAPVAAGVLRSTAGLVMFAASLLTLPTTMATPFLTGVSLVMLTGGVAATIKACRDEAPLRRFGRVFPLAIAVLAGVTVVVTVVVGPGAYAPNLAARPARPVDDGTIRFVP